MTKQKLINPNCTKGTGILCLYTIGFAGLRATIKVQGGETIIKEWRFSANHPQVVAIEAANFVYRNTLKRYKWSEDDFKSLLSYVVSDKFWGNFNRAAKEFEDAGRSPSDTLTNRCSMILTPTQSARDSALKYLSLRPSKNGKSATLFVTTYKHWKENLDSDLVRYRYTCHGYRELFKVTATYVALVLCTFEEAFKNNFGQQYVFSAYFTMVSKWREDIEREGLESFFFDHESSELDLNITTFLQHVDAELEGFNQKSMFGSKTRGIKTIGQIGLSKQKETMEDRFVEYNQNRLDIVKPLLKAYPNGFNSSDLADFLQTKMRLNNSYVSRVLSWECFEPTLKTKGNSLAWVVSDINTTATSTQTPDERYVAKLSKLLKALKLTAFDYSDLKRLIGDGCPTLPFFLKIFDRTGLYIAHTLTGQKKYTFTSIYLSQEKTDSVLAKAKSGKAQRLYELLSADKKLATKKTFSKLDAIRIAGSELEIETITNVLRNKSLFEFIGKHRKDSRYRLVAL